MEKFSGNGGAYYRVVTKIRGKPPLTNWLTENLEDAVRAQKEQELSLTFHPEIWTVAIEVEKFDSKRALIATDGKKPIRWIFLRLRPPVSLLRDLLFKLFALLLVLLPLLPKLRTKLGVLSGMGRGPKQSFASSERHGERSRLAQSIAGATLVEAMITTAIVALFMSGAFAVNGHLLTLLRSTKDTSAAELCIRDRLERVRNAPWERMVDPNYLQNTVLSSQGDAFPRLSELIVSIDVSAFPPSKSSPGAASIIVRRDANGIASIFAPGDGNMEKERTVKVTVTASWQAANRIRTKEAYSLVSRSGISGRNK
ncbi:MAG: hypothetical protein JWL90_883 [Chthoniobacteraceae bacterium]|nr:hypothetical protein [Chthoniobacteraceae bacterium]